MVTYRKISIATGVFISALCIPAFIQASSFPETLPKNQTVTTESVSLRQAQVIAQAAEKKAREIKVPMVIAVVDPSGNLILHERMENALPVSIDVSMKKAYSAIALKMSTQQLSKVTQPGKELYGIQHSDDRLITFGGGIPILQDGKVIGAIGVSGGSVAEDISVAEAGLAAFK